MSKMGRGDPLWDSHLTMENNEGTLCLGKVENVLATGPSYFYDQLKTLPPLKALENICTVHRHIVFQVSNHRK